MQKSLGNGLENQGLCNELKHLDKVLTIWELIQNEAGVCVLWLTSKEAGAGWLYDKTQVVSGFYEVGSLGFIDAATISRKVWRSDGCLVEW